MSSDKSQAARFLSCPAGCEKRVLSTEQQLIGQTHRPAATDAQEKAIGIYDSGCSMRRTPAVVYVQITLIS